MASRVCKFCFTKHFVEKQTLDVQKSVWVRPYILWRKYASLDNRISNRAIPSYGFENSAECAKSTAACSRWNFAVCRIGGATAPHRRKLTTTSQRYISEGTDSGQKIQKIGAMKLKNKLEKVKEMKEDILTVPNLLSTLRIVASPVLAYLIVSEDYITAAILFGVAGVTDMLDGYIARNFKNQKSVFGTALDPLSDKILISTLIISLMAVSLLPVPLTVLILSRDVALVISAFYLRYKSLPAPKTFSRYFDFNLPTVELRPTFISKVNTALQLGLVGCTLLAPIFHYTNHPYLEAFWYVVAGSTILSGASYLLSKSTVRYLK